MLYGQIYAMLELELLAFGEYIQENTAEGLIHCVMSPGPARAPILFV